MVVSLVFFLSAAVVAADDLFRQDYQTHRTVDGKIIAYVFEMIHLHLPCFRSAETLDLFQFRLALLKFMFSKKATKIDEIFTVDLTLTI